MKKVLLPIILSGIVLCACQDKKTDLALYSDSTSTSDTATAATAIVDTTPVADPFEKKVVIPANSKTVDSLLKKPVTTPANNPFGLRAGDDLLTSSAIKKDPLNMRMKIILGDKFDDYKTFLSTAKVLKKDSDGFLYTQGAAAKGSKDQAFFLYHHENDVLFLGYQKDGERMMLNDMKSRMFAPQTVDTWVERPIE
jgi:hypothetical protein